jgi:uncharacterized membrane protein (UPF0182 family)
VIVAYENRIVMQETLEEGIAELFGGKFASPSTTSTSTAAPTPSPQAEGAPRPASASADLTGLATEAQAHYERAVAAQKGGDWATYGEELRQLGQVLERMRAR